MWEVKDDVIIETTWAGNKIYQAKIGLLKDKYWRHILKDYPLDLLCAIRKELKESTPLLTEKFNSSNVNKSKLFYFGYKKKFNSSLANISRADYSEDKAYIYLQKKNLVIDLHIEPSYVSKLEKEDFVIKPRDNFQGQAGWLTGWQVPQSTTDADRVVNWLCKAFEENL